MEQTPITNKNAFYNVMPEAVGGPLIQTNKSAAPVASDIPRPRKPMNKWLVLAPIVVVILIAVGFAVWYFLIRQNDVVEIEVQDNTQQAEASADVTTPGDWLAKYFSSETCTELTQCGDSADPDRDGLNNKAEYGAGTDPNNPDCDSDGIADGDEVNVFGSDPLLSKTYRQGNYNDADFVKGGFDFVTDRPYNGDQLIAIKAKVQTSGLHQPTLTTIGELAYKLYEFTDPNPAPALPSNIDQSVQAKLDRDTQRQTTIKKVGAAILKYKEAKKTFPAAVSFVAMTEMIKPYNLVATNYNDPINLNQYVYGYQLDNNGQDFTLTYYSETQNQLIKYKSADAIKDQAKENTQGNDDARMRDLETIRNALLIYSSSNIDPNSQNEYVFPTGDKYKTSLVPKYLTTLPKDPVSGQDYVYQVGPQFTTFTIKALLQNPPAGTTGYMCNQEECSNF